jgi:hypothetical protein
MSQKTQHPSIQRFKQFVKKHPRLVTEVRESRKTWQELFEDWYLLGEEDSIWDQYKEESKKQAEKSKEKKGDFMSMILTAVKGMDLSQMEHHISNVGQAITNIQSLISQFQSKDSDNGLSKTKQPNHPFFYNKD